MPLTVQGYTRVQHCNLLCGCDAAAEDQEGDGINLAAPKRRKRTWEQASDEEDEDPEAVEAARKEAEMEADRSAHIKNTTARVQKVSLATGSHCMPCISSKLPCILSNAPCTSLQCYSSCLTAAGLIISLGPFHNTAHDLGCNKPAFACTYTSKVLSSNPNSI